MCAGYRDGSTDQALASDVVGKLLAELRQRFDLVVIDTGPVLTSPDAMLLGQHVDGAVISVRRDVSRLPKVTEACNRLRSVGVQIAGAVVNGAGYGHPQERVEADRSGSGQPGSTAGAGLVS